MSKRADLAVKCVCGALAALLIVQLVRLAAADDPLANPAWDEPAPSNGAHQAGKKSGKKDGKTERQPGEIAPAVRARVETIKSSEVFGPVPRPLPMALLGIAGPDAFIRTATGQTGLLRENEELGGVKLLKIGTNRVLVEHEGKKTELTLFAGLGGEPLMSREESK